MSQAKQFMQTLSLLVALLGIAGIPLSTAQAGTLSAFIVVANGKVTGMYNDLEQAKAELNKYRKGTSRPSRMIAEVKDGVVQGNPHVVGGERQGDGLKAGFNKWWWNWNDINFMVKVAKGYFAGADTDSDGVINDDDNCLAIANSGQEDADGDGIGDVCEADTDGDGIIDDNDNCSNDANQVVPTCQDAQIDMQMMSKLITGCKADPDNGDHRWICDEPTRQEKTEVKKATVAVFQGVCRDETVPEPNDVCLATQIYSLSWGGLLDELINKDDSGNCPDVANLVVPDCQAALDDKQTVLKLIRGCKADPENGDHQWICEDPTRQEATKIKNATDAVYQAVCRDQTEPESKDVCLATQIGSFSWGGQLVQ